MSNEDPFEGNEASEGNKAKFPSYIKVISSKKFDPTKLQTIDLSFVAPSQEYSEPEPEPEPEPLWDTEVIVREESDSYRFFNVYLDSQKRELVICAPSYILVEGVDQNAIMNASAHSDVFPLDKVVVYDVDDQQIPTCKFYVPCQANIDGGAEQVDDYYFTKNPVAPACRCPALHRDLNPPFQVCTFSSSKMPKCSGYEANQPVIISTLVVNGTPTKHVFRRYVSFGIPVYSFAKTGTDTHTLEEIEAELEEEIKALRDQDMLATVVPNFDTLETVPYIKTVLFEEQ